jgi:hypothetical protein
MAWNHDYTGLKYHQKVTRNSTTESTQMHLFVGFDDKMGSFVSGLLMGFTSLTYIVEIEAG